MTLSDLGEIASQIYCEIGGHVWNWKVGKMGDGYFIQLRYVEEDVETGDVQDQHGRKWYISSHAIESEVVQTVLKACLTSAERMVREHFTYKGERVFSPHFDINDLITLSRSKKRVARQPSGDTVARATIVQGRKSDH